MMAKKKREFPPNPVAVVTGSSRGIGRAVAMELGKSGCKVVNYATSAGPAEEVVNEIKALGNGADAIAVKANIGDVNEIRTLMGEAEEKFGPINILVNNAGITNDMLVMMMKPEDFTGVIDVNLNGVFYASQAAFTSMMPKRIGRIINVASIVGQIGNPGQANYAAAKGGVIGMTRPWQRSLVVAGVTVNAVCPGFIESDMTKDLIRLPIVRYPSKALGAAERGGWTGEILSLRSCLCVYHGSLLQCRWWYGYWSDIAGRYFDISVWLYLIPFKNVHQHTQPTVYNTSNCELEIIDLYFLSNIPSLIIYSVGPVQFVLGF